MHCLTALLYAFPDVASIIFGLVPVSLESVTSGRACLADICTQSSGRHSQP